MKNYPKPGVSPDLLEIVVGCLVVIALVAWWVVL